MDYVDASGLIKLSIGGCGCSRLDIANTMVKLTKEDLADLLYVFKNAITYLEDDKNRTPITEESCSSEPRLTLVKENSE